MLKRTADFLDSNRDRLMATYPGKFLLLASARLQSVHDSWEDAFFEAMQTFDPGTFIIERAENCKPGEVLMVEPLAGLAE
jgi:hypothetical protein